MIRGCSIITSRLEGGWFLLERDAWRWRAQKWRFLCDIIIEEPLLRKQVMDDTLINGLLQ